MKEGNEEFDGGSLGLIIFLMTALWFMVFYSDVFR